VYVFRIYSFNNYSNDSIFSAASAKASVAYERAKIGFTCLPAPANL